MLHNLTESSHEQTSGLKHQQQHHSTCKNKLDNPQHYKNIYYFQNLKLGVGHLSHNNNYSVQQQNYKLNNNKSQNVDPEHINDNLIHQQNNNLIPVDILNHDLTPQTINNFVRNVNNITFTQHVSQLNLIHNYGGGLPLTSKRYYVRQYNKNDFLYINT